ncbi:MULTISPECIES: hypothetical protein [unclassified Bradyrhizobium]|uniref:GumC family protein n=1 Tax=unclassified Bradyrhizobium TaxID=2631580 RepID=UPI00247AF192|nr:MULTISPECIES: hypothetical protein [unclassified Bradyrhizobium]WGR70588.1 hypothetical protein MTX24_35580 [Bradyrhizobium sp. ISRA426]WGR75425.1 hypothetical protein MTX21_20680 [Bradyrhizobium sp. ISRA430]WGR85828.1 hypothetical protein MTX25_35265 [Bradyrhizobium sp. ISRA432]
MELLLAAKVLIAALRRRKVVALAVFLTVLAASLFAYQLVGRRYNAEALLLVGNGVKDSESRSVVDSRSIVDPTGINSLARLAETDDVVREAANKVGLQRLFPDLDRMHSNDGTLIAELGVKRWFSADQISTLRETAAKLGLERLLPAHENRRKDDILISMLRRSMSAQAEGKTDLLKISFPHRDPVIAAEFVNALADALVAKQVELLNVPGAFQFFVVQRKQLQEEVQKAASRLENFSAAVSIYSIHDQRTLLLNRADQLNQSLSSTQGSIVELQGRKEALTEQLLRLKPVTQSQYVSGIVSSLGATNVERAESDAKTSRTERSLTEAPPLLLIRVYQDTMDTLFKVNADLAGAKNRETHFGTELQRVNNELSTLSSREAEYNRLSRDLALAVAAAESYAKRTTEERINTSLANARVSGLRIAQLARPPDSPAFPQLIIFLALGLVGGAVLASAAALLPEALASVRTYDAVSPGSAEAATDVPSRIENRAKPHVV